MENFTVICNKCGGKNVDFYTKMPQEEATLECKDCGAITHVEFDGLVVEA